MRPRCNLLLPLILLALTSGLGPAERSPRFLVHLLDYLAKDYGGAVGDGGTVSSASEYREQREFSDSAAETSAALPELAAHPEIRTGVERLRSLIAEKAPPPVVAALARELQQRVIDATHLPVAPTAWPSLAAGRELFAANCAPCHGPAGRGDGPAGAALTPKPADLAAPKAMADTSPLQVFNTVRLGVPGTAMPAFAGLSDEDSWAVAFYVIGLRHTATAAAESPAGEPAGLGLLTRAATASDTTLASSMSAGDIDRLRRYDRAAAGQAPTLALARTLLANASAAYRRGDVEAAKTLALQAYLDGIEPVEPRLRASEPAAVGDTEARMSAVRGAVDAGRSADAVEAAVAAATLQIDAIEAMLVHKDLSPAIALTAAVTIMLREGFEAVLLILALLSVIRATGAPRAARWVHGGWLAALAAGGVAWAFSGYLMDLSGARREQLEAWTSLFAVLVLLVVGFWLHSRTEIGRWNHFLKVRVRRAMTGKNLVGLASIAFVAVFREAVETVLFLRAIWLEGGAPARLAMACGVGGTLVVIIAGSWAVLRSSAHLPVRKLFAASAVVMAVLALILTGKGLHSLQETGALGVSTAVVPVHWDWLGLYPTNETLVAQALVLGLVAGLWVYGRRPSGRAKVS